MTHHLKIQPEYYEAVCNGTKRFEVRRDDRTPRYTAGDTLVLEEIDANRQKTGRQAAVCVDYVYRGAFCLDGYCIMSIRLLQEGGV